MMGPALGCCKVPAQLTLHVWGDATYLNIQYHLPSHSLWMFKRLLYIVDRPKWYTTVQVKTDVRIGLGCLTYPRPLNFASQ